MRTIVCWVVPCFLLAPSIAAADIIVKTSEPIVSVSDSANFSLSDPPPYNLAAQVTYPFVNLYFNPNVGTLNSVTAEFEVSIPIFVVGTSQSVSAAGEIAAISIGGTAGVQVRLETAVLNSAVVPFNTDCTAVGNGDGVPDKCTIGDGAQIDSTPAGVLSFNHVQTFSGIELTPFLINDSQPRMFIDVDVGGDASGDVSSALIWARTFGIPGARVLLTLTYDYTPGGADTDADGIGDSVDNCTFAFNPDQTDVNGDGIGNICDADVTGPGGDNAEDCLVNFLDLQRIKGAFFSNPASPTWDAEVDLDNNNLVNFVDLQILKGQFFGLPGPSASGCN